MIVIDLLGVKSGVTNHDVAVNGDGEDGEKWYGHQAVPCHGEQLAQ